MQNFPHQNIVEFLREQIWQRKPGRAAGRASVMVGAGFSLNGVPMSNSARAFQTWSQLVGILSNSLYPGADQAETAAGTSGALRLAQEFEAVFGRFRLEEVIRGAVPDAEYHPGDLHRRLLTLPWADVFTTNWDTLIERARFDVYERIYDVVLTQSQIPSASVPRIVKLHGTLPAHTPFIFTEEDFRTYPSRFAPFVNLVQQAMMENAFVLLGFSGDDPNFLHWSGWVRDNLGGHAPKIYLVNWLALNGQRRRMLEERNVIPLDLADLPQAKTWPPEMRYRLAMEWFLHSMEMGRPPRASAWPHLSIQQKPLPAYLGWMPSGIAPKTIDEPYSKTNITSSMEDKVSELKSVVSIWKINRGFYPGWFIAPAEVRNRIWQATVSWLGAFSSTSANFSEREKITAIRELLWRLEICLISPEIVTGLLETIKSTIDIIDLENRSIRLTDGSNAQLIIDETDGIKHALHEIAKVARRMGQEKEFLNALESLAKICKGDAEFEEKIRYESLLWHVHRLDHNKVERELDNWDVDTVDPVWGLRKAALLAGTERLHDARFVIRTALTRIRRERRRDVDDYPSLSKEAWGMWLVLAWHNHWEVADSQVPDDSDPFERWRELSLYDCNAMGEYRSLLSEMLQTIPTSDTSRTRAFDLGYASTRVHLRNGLPGAFRAALQMVKLSELTGLPPSSNNVSLLGEGISKAALLLAEDYQLQSSLLTVICASAGEDDIIENFFSRARIALLTFDSINQLRTITISSFDYSITRARPPETRHTYWHKRLRISLEILSRLVLRFSPEEACQILDKAKGLYCSSWALGDPWMSSELGRLFKRSIESLPKKNLLDCVPYLLDLPIPGTASFFPNGPQLNWRDPAEIIRLIRLDLRVSKTKIKISMLPGLVSRIISAGLEGVLARRFATARLLILKDMELLSSDEETAFADLLWSEDGRADGSLPRDVGIYPWVFLVLPEPELGKAEQAFRKTFLERRDKRNLIGDVLSNIGNAIKQTKLRTRKFILNPADLAVVDSLIEEWADMPSIPSSLFATSERDDEALAVTGIGLILTEYRVSADSLHKIWDKATRLEEDKKNGVYPFVLYPGLIQAFPDRVDELVQRLRQGVISADPDIASEAVVGCFRWIETAQSSNDIPDLPSDLIRELGSIIAARRRVVVTRALEIARWIFSEGPVSAREIILGNCNLGLMYLLTEASYEAELRGGANEGFDVALIRRNCVALALSMHNAGFTSLTGVISWIEVASNDPLPEVRNFVVNASC